MPFYDVDITKTIKDDFIEYSGHVMQERSIPDARDGLKDGARKILYSQYINKNVHKNNFIKGQAATGQALITGFLHGDSSAYNTMVRMGKYYAVPYPLEEIQGNGGNQTSPDSHAAGRYLEIRQSELASYLFNGIEKNVIKEWYKNYSDTLDLPRVLPSIGFYPIINGLSGIAVGLSTSIPPTNLIEVNNAIIKLIKNQNVAFEEIYCPPDFPMGGKIINGSEVEESMRNGHGKSIKMQARLDYIADKNMIVATQIPFSVYTDTICAELLEIINGEDNCGIAKFIDATNDEGALINIYLDKDVNVKKIMNILLTKTSLGSSYGINMIMLDNGRFPKVFGWKDALLNYIEHIRDCKRSELRYDLDRFLARKNIVNGLLVAAANIEEIIKIIRAANNPHEAGIALAARFDFNEEQIKAILAIKLASLTKIDAIKLNDELNEINKKIENINFLLSHPEALDQELIKVLLEVSQRFGRPRKTKILSINDEDEFPKEAIEGIVSIDHNNHILFSTDAKMRRKLLGKKSLLFEQKMTDQSSVLLFSNRGKGYKLFLSDLDENDFLTIDTILKLNGEKIIFAANSDLCESQDLIITTKCGNIKRFSFTSIFEINCRGRSLIKLSDDDEIFTYLISSKNSNIICIQDTGRKEVIDLDSIPEMGVAAKGKTIFKKSVGKLMFAAPATTNIQFSIFTSAREFVTTFDELSLQRDEKIKKIQVKGD